MIVTFEEWREFLETVSTYDLVNIITGYDDGQLSLDEAAEQLEGLTNES